MSGIRCGGRTARLAGVVALLGLLAPLPAGAGGSAAPAVGPEHPVSTQADAEDAAVAFDGTNYLVVWEDQGINDLIRAVRVAPNGDIVDFRFSVSTGPGVDPAVAFDGTNFLVVWGDHTSPAGPAIRAALIPAREDGQDHFPFTVVQGDGVQTSNADVAWNGTSFLVVYGQGSSPLHSIDMKGTRVSPTGALLAPANFTISNAPDNQLFPAVAAGGNQFLVAWTDSRNGGFDLYGSRVSAGGVVRDPAGIPISTAANQQVVPDVDYDGTRWLATWSDRRSGNSDVFATRVSTGGVVRDPAGLPVSTGPGAEGNPSVAAQGPPFFVAWKEDRSGTSADGVYAARVGGGTGDVVDSPAFLVSAQATQISAKGRPDVAAGLGDGWAVVYDRTEVFLRTVSPK